MPLFPFFALDYPTHLCSFVHHVWVGMFLIVGSASHADIHNDSLECLGRVEDCFGDSCVQLRPLFANYLWGLTGFGLGFGLGSVRGRIYYTWSELGTSDFMVHHVHAFTIHVTVLVLVKGVLNSRGSRLVSDKGSLGFR